MKKGNCRIVPLLKNFIFEPHCYVSVLLLHCHVTSEKQGLVIGTQASVSATGHMRKQWNCRFVFSKESINIEPDKLVRECDSRPLSKHHSA